LIIASNIGQQHYCLLTSGRKEIAKERLVISLRGVHTNVSKIAQIQRGVLQEKTISKKVFVDIFAQGTTP